MPNHDWTIRFIGVNNGDPFEFRPISLSLELSREEYDFCRATIPYEVAEMMKPETRFKDGKLYGLTPVDVCYEGDPVQRLLFRPDWINYGSDQSQLQLHDLQKAMADGVVDEQRGTAKLRRIYRYVLEQVPNDFIEGLKFTLPDTTVRTLYGHKGVFNYREGGFHLRSAETEINRSKTKKIVDGNYAVDFDEISPEKAIRRLNKKFSLKSWVNREGKLIVGLPEAKSVRHIAAPDDERVWRYSDPSIPHDREPVEAVVVWGSWIDEPGIDPNVLNWFNKGGTSDVKAVGIAKRQDIDYGTAFSVSNTNAKRNALPEVAEVALQERMKNQHSGSVTIDPELSGEKISSVIDAEVGDSLHLVPDDDFFDRHSADTGRVGDPPKNYDGRPHEFVNNEAYLVNGVRHTVPEKGDWEVTAQVGMFPDVEIKSYMAYFDPNDEKWVSEDQVNEDGELAGGLLTENYRINKEDI